MCSPQRSQDFNINTAVRSIYFLKQGRSEEISGSYICDQSAEILKTRGRKAEKQNKAGAGELFASLISAKLAQNWRKTWRFSGACESGDEFRVCKIENWTVVGGRGYSGNSLSNKLASHSEVFMANTIKNFSWVESTKEDGHFSNLRTWKKGSQFNLLGKQVRK